MVSALPAQMTYFTTSERWPPTRSESLKRRLPTRFIGFLDGAESHHAASKSGWREQKRAPPERANMGYQRQAGDRRSPRHVDYGAILRDGHYVLFLVEPKRSLKCSGVRMIDGAHRALLHPIQRSRSRQANPYSLDLFATFSGSGRMHRSKSSVARTRPCRFMATPPTTT
jgi:hypothetical protein